MVRAASPGVGPFNKQSGGSVSYEWEWSNAKAIPEGRPWGPRFLVDLIGADYFRHVSDAAIEGETDVEWRQAKDMTYGVLHDGFVLSALAGCAPFWTGVRLKPDLLGLTARVVRSRPIGTFGMVVSFLPVVQRTCFSVRWRVFLQATLLLEFLLFFPNSCSHYISSTYVHRSRRDSS